MKKMKLDNRELATVLAGLRCLQVTYPDFSGGTPANDFDHFEDVEPLDNFEIDVLCEELNCVEEDEDD
jgi:hypothetical protein